MLNISAKQMEAFRQYQLEKHAERVDRLLVAIEPGFAEALTEAEIRRISETVVANAGLVHFDDDTQFHDFAQFSVYFGTGFLTDPQCLWANRLFLNRRELVDGRALAVAGKGAIAREWGPNGTVAREVIARAALDLENLKERSLTAHASLPQLTASLIALWPERAEGLGPVRLERLALDHVRRARALGATGPVLLIFVAVFFILGSMADEDPLFPWFNSLRGSAVADSRAVVDQLLQRLPATALVTGGRA